MKYAVLTVTLLFLSFLSLSAQQWYIGGFINGGYSDGINAKYPEVNYEIIGKGSITHGLSVECEFKKYSFQLEFNRLNIGHTIKAFAGFSPADIVPTVIGRYPIFFNVKHNYNYTQVGLKGYYLLNPKIKIGLGFHPSMINKESIWIQNRITISGEQPEPTVLISEGRGYRDYENFQPYNLFLSANFKYKIWKYISVNMNYIISTFSYNGDDHQIATGNKFYHQGVYGGLEFTYPL